MKLRVVGPILVFFLSSLAGAQNPSNMLADGRVDQAIETLQRQISTNSGDAESYNLLCRAYFMMDEWDRAISACEHAVKLAPDVSRYHLWLGRSYGEKADRSGFISATGLAKKVRAEFERAVELDPKGWEARVDLAEFYLEAPSLIGGGHDKARAQAQELMRLKPALAHWVLARLDEKEKDGGGAEREYRAAIEVSHGGAHAWLNLAIYYFHAKRFDDMENALRTMATRPMDRPESLMDGATLLFRSERDYPFAIQLLRRYLADPVEAQPAFRAHVLLGQILEKQGDSRAAADQYRQALALDHDYARAREALKHVAG